MGKAYDDAYSGWLYRNGFSERKDLPENERPPLLKEKERTFLLRCMTHLDEITAWRCGLTDYQRRSWNHPRTVWEHFEKDMQPAPDADLSNIEENPEDFEDAKKEVEKKKLEIELTNACVLRLKGVIDPSLLQAAIMAAGRLDGSREGAN